MIPGFEEFTCELEEAEKDIAEAIAEMYNKDCVGKKKALSNRQVRKMFSNSGLKIHDATFRKMIQYIRVNNLCFRLCASGCGYYVAENDKEWEDYQESMRKRIRAMQFTYQCGVYYDQIKRNEKSN